MPKRFGWVFILVLWLGGYLCAYAQAPTHVTIVIISTQSGPHQAEWAQGVAQRAALLCAQEGLSPAQLPIIRYDFDNDSNRARYAALQVDRTDLMYVGVVDLPPDGPPHVLFYLRNVNDVERSARAAVEAARGVLGQASEVPVVETLAASRQSAAFYLRLLTHPQLANHIGTQNVADVMKDIRTRSVDIISDKQMDSGIILQARDLLWAAQVPNDALQAIPVDSSLPDAIFQAYSSRVNPDVLGLAEIRGALMPLDDPFSAYLPPEQAQILNHTLGDAASYTIGLHLEASRQHPGQVVILTVQPESPASEGGLQPGDIVVKVDGKPVDGLAADLVSSMLGGTAGSSLVLTVQRGDKVWDTTLQRRSDKLKTVISYVMAMNIGYIRLSVFGTTSGAEVESAMAKLKASGAKALILDLRNNGGGYVRAAQQICSLFLPKGKVIMSVVGRGGVHQDLTSTGPGTYRSMPVVVLVNGFTASAAEATAGCLHDQKIAYLMGSTTYGKGSMQSPFSFPDQSMLKLTVGRWYSPDGVMIDKVGLTPDIDVPSAVFGDQADGDVQLKKAYELLRAQMTMPP